jgi:hypothetical protein
LIRSTRFCIASLIGANSSSESMGSRRFSFQLYVVKGMAETIYQSKWISGNGQERVQPESANGPRVV